MEVGLQRVNDLRDQDLGVWGPSPEANTGQQTVSGTNPAEAGGQPRRPARRAGPSGWHAGGSGGVVPPRQHSARHNPWVRSQRISASMKSSISPSITAVVFPVSMPVRRSLMFWYGCRT